MIQVYRWASRGGMGRAPVNTRLREEGIKWLPGRNLIPSARWEVPVKAYYGVQTLRAKNNFHITGRPLHGEFIRNLARIKKAAAFTNMTAHVLDERVGNAIVAACDEIIGGKLHGQFIVDAIQGGAGTSANMNANEVIANGQSRSWAAQRGPIPWSIPMTM